MFNGLITCFICKPLCWCNCENCMNCVCFAHLNIIDLYFIIKDKNTPYRYNGCNFMDYRQESIRKMNAHVSLFSCVHNNISDVLGFPMEGRQNYELRNEC